MERPPNFPAGEYLAPGKYPDSEKLNLIEKLEAVPAGIRKVVSRLNDNQLDTKYNNWTIRQFVHHVADSHINCYVRFKWTLTEETPLIKSYDESLWSETIDAKTVPLECSIQILQGVHSRWCQLLRKLDGAEMQRGFLHPETNQVVTLADALPNYVWHSNHHIAQIEWVKNKNGW